MSDDSVRSVSRSSPYPSSETYARSVAPSVEGIESDEISFERARIVEFLREAFERANADGVIVAMSGGVDSTSERRVVSAISRPKIYVQVGANICRS